MQTLPTNLPKRLGGFKWFHLSFWLFGMRIPFLLGRCMNQSQEHFTLSLWEEMVQEGGFYVEGFHHSMVPECIPPYNKKCNLKKSSLWRNKSPWKSPFLGSILVLLGCIKHQPGNYSEQWCPFLVLLSMIQTTCSISMLAGELLAKTRTFPNRKYALPETNIAPENRSLESRRFLFETIMSSGNVTVSFRECTSLSFFNWTFDWQKRSPKMDAPTNLLEGPAYTGFQKDPKISKGSLTGQWISDTDSPKWNLQHLSKMLRINLSHPFPDHASHFWPKLKKKPPHLWVGGLFMGEFFDLHPGLCLAGQPTLPGPRNPPKIKAY